MGSNKLKILAPAQNPHICFVDRKYKNAIQELKQVTGKTFYSLLCTCANCRLNNKENIKKFKEHVRGLGYKNIGDWAEHLIVYLYDRIDSLNEIDLSKITLKKEVRE